MPEQQPEPNPAGEDESGLRAQYEAYPYPARDPADEARRLVIGSPSHLAEINHYLFAGRRDFTRPFRALIAGGGTGDGTIMLAQQLASAGGGGEVVYLDLSERAMAIAQARARARKLDNIRFIQGSLGALAALDLGRFDYIDCCGVLHHLPDPAQALRALGLALVEDGGIGVMVYGELGRTGVYHVQDALRRIVAGEGDKMRLAIARRLLADLPAGNWLKRNPLLADHLHGDDAGLYDLLLHSRDRAFRIGQVFDLVAAAGLSIAALIEPCRYDPASYLRDPQVLERARALPARERAEFAELVSGTMKRHVFYALKGSAEGRLAEPDSPAVVPLLREGHGGAMARGLKPGGPLIADLEGLRVSLPLPRLGPAILARIDGRLNLNEIHRDLSGAIGGIAWERFKSEFDKLYRAMTAINVMLLRHPAG